MISWLKRIFIPHERNNHRPEILDRKNIRNIFILILFVESSLFLLPTLTRINMTGGMASVLPTVLSGLTNEMRKDQNLGILKVNEDLNKAAEMKAKDMAEKGYFAHMSPDGKTPWYWIEKVGYKYKYAGENLAINFSDSKDVVEAWMKSQTHKANIIKKNYTEVGTGVALGMYQGRETLFVVQIYANKMSVDSKDFTSKEIVKKIPKINKEENKNVLGSETLSESNFGKENTEVINKISQKPSLLQRLFISPHKNTNMILLFIFGIIFISLLLNIFIKIEHKHPDLIVNGLMVLVVIGAIFIANSYMSNRDMITLDGFEYSSALLE